MHVDDSEKLWEKRLNKLYKRSFYMINKTLSPHFCRWEWDTGFFLWHLKILFRFPRKCRIMIHLLKWRNIIYKKHEGKVYSCINEAHIGFITLWIRILQHHLLRNEGCIVNCKTRGLNPSLSSQITPNFANKIFY